MQSGNEPVDSSGDQTGAVLFQQAQAGCRDSLNRLMAIHEKLVQAVVRRQVLGCLPFGEALQAGRIGLWRAVQGYRLERGLAFSTYAWTCIMHQVWQAVKGAQRAARVLPMELAAGGSYPPGTADPAEAWEADAVRAAVWELVSRLPEQLRLVVVARYGLTGEGRAFYPCIGALLGVSAERARQLHVEALLWLRQPAHSQQLRSLLDRHTIADYEAVEADTRRWLQGRGGRDGR